ncbi:MAG: hypothetical protein HKN27_06110 [Silicimonas sp.]|nr:hypothetical protein [Silicimonas sp.]
MRIWLLSAACLFIAACTTEEDLSQPPAPLGQFRLGHNIAIADNTTRGPFSRDFSEMQIETAVQNAVAKRLRRYDGDGLYHMGIVVGGLVLAQPGIPVVYAPSSVMIVDVTVFDNTTQRRLNAEPERLTVGEGISNAVPLLGSGLVRDADQQLENLSNALARAIEDWLKDNPEWFTPRPGQQRVAYDLKTQAPKIDTSTTSDIAQDDQAAN